MGMFVKALEEINRDMFQDCGGKAAHLGELTRMGLNVPKGFCVVAKAFFEHLRANNLVTQVLKIAESINYDDFQDLEQKTSEIRSLIESAEMPREIENEIIESYQHLSKEEPNPFVAIRSSVAVKGTSISSFPGLMDTYHYIRGSKEVIDSVRRCFASVWTARATFARHQRGIDHSKAIIAPVVQLMVNSEVAGVIFTVNPMGKEDEIVIESNWGLGETVVSGKVMNDLYIIDKRTGRVKIRQIAKKERTYVQKANGLGAEWVEVEPVKMTEPTLTDIQIDELRRVGLLIEEHFGYPQDIEWAYEKNVLYILQARRAKVEKK